jgi:hypothetical protein
MTLRRAFYVSGLAGVALTIAGAMIASTYGPSHPPPVVIRLLLPVGFLPIWGDEESVLMGVVVWTTNAAMLAVVVLAGIVGVPSLAGRSAKSN